MDRGKKMKLNRAIVAIQHLRSVHRLQATYLKQLHDALVSEEESYMDSDENDEEDEDTHRIINSLTQRATIEKIEGLVVVGSDEKQFQEAFRLSRGTFEKLLSLVEPQMKKEPIDPELPGVKHQLLAIMWLLGTQETCRSICERLNMSESSLSKTFSRIIYAVKSLSSSVITWPNAEQREENRRKFQALGKLRNVIGAIDGTYVPIKAPKEGTYSYKNKKKFTAITLQAITNPDLKFIDCYVGYPSGVHETRIFRNSWIYGIIEADKERYCPNDDVIVGDKAYPINNWCIPPFNDNGSLDEKQKNFNRALASTHQVIDRSFALLFGRWRRLRYLDMYSVETIPRTILACCVLHNLCLACSDDMTEEYIRQGSSIAERSRTNDRKAVHQTRPSGVMLRNQMMESICTS